MKYCSINIHNYRPNHPLLIFFQTVLALTVMTVKQVLKRLQTFAETLFCVSAGVKVTLSALIDGKNFNAGGHKVGMGFELEA